MRVTVLASDHPNFAHSAANSIVLAALLEGLARNGASVSWATAGALTPLNDGAATALNRIGVQFVGDFTEFLSFGPASGIRSKAGLMRKALISWPEDDLPRFRDASKVVDALARSKPDVLLLFWDTWFEHLVPSLGGFRLAGFLAKPRHDAPLTRFRAGMVSGRLRHPVRRWVARRVCEFQKERHFARMRKLDVIGEICALDVAAYRAEGLRAEYVPIPVPDYFADTWQHRWDRPFTGGGFGIIGALGTLNALGSQIGMDFWATEVLPTLRKRLRSAWQIHIYGRGELPPAVQGLRDDAHVRIDGYVEDIDAAMLGQPIFLFCNNAGPYRGTYTRVPYAFASATCFVGHRRLADSVPEVTHGENALLGDSGPEIADLVAQAAASPQLRRQLGQAARRTYERWFSPHAVGARLARLLATGAT